MYAKTGRDAATGAPMPDAPAGERDAHDEAALGALYDVYADALFAFAMRRLGERALAESVVQDVFTRVWQSASRYSPARGSVRTWLYAVTRHAVVDRVRAQDRRPRVAGTAAPAVELAADDELDALLDAAAMRAALEQLAERHRRVLELAYFEARSVRDIAAILDVPVGTVKSRTYYALRALRLACEELGIEP